MLSKFNAKRRLAAWLMGAAGMVALGFPAFAESRVALVIGNGAYKSVPELANPPSDAKDVADALRSLGFKVTLAIDADQAHMRQAIAEFSKASESASVSLFYYGGHGLQVAAHNYLIPTDARIASTGDVEKNTVHFDDVLEAQSKGSGIHLVFLDACRVNPFKKGAGELQSSGLARVGGGSASGFLVAFATQPDNIAFDGAGRNSPFAQALLAHVATPGVDISSMMISVRRDVIAATGGAQIPYDSSALTKQFYFAGDAEAGTSPEAMLWQLAAGQRDRNLLDIYLQRYPNGSHADDVRALEAQIGAGSAPTVKPSAPVEEDLWRLALGSRERSLVELYLARYPAGVHAKDAEALAESLRASAAKEKDPALVCERLATVPSDATASAPGVEFAVLATHAAEAVEVCQQAVTARPEAPHYVALLARATLASGRYDEGIALYRKAADAGDGRAMYSLGHFLESGDHVPKDVKGAYALYEKAAARGNADGAIDLGFAYAEGKFGERNLNRAYELFLQGSRAGSARATYDLATLVSQGVHGKPSDALDIFRQAADMGEPHAFRAIAVIFDSGKLTTKDPNAAAEALLRCVSADSGECLNELAGKTDKWSPETVKAIQGKLKTANYYAGPLDGKSGPALGPALKQWRWLGPPQKT